MAQPLRMEATILRSHSDKRQERQLLEELLDLIATNKLSLARKVLSTQAFMQDYGRALSDQDRLDAG